jgi:hypothetical protein
MERKIQVFHQVVDACGFFVQAVVNVEKEDAVHMISREKGFRVTVLRRFSL